MPDKKQEPSPKRPSRTDTGGASRMFLGAMRDLQQQRVAGKLQARVKDQVDARCICHRPPCDIKCSSCGAMTTGRYRGRRCPVHPNVAYLHDTDHCSTCKSTNISEVNGTTAN